MGTLGCSAAHAPGIHPGAIEICGDGIDQNCDGIDPPCTSSCTTDADGDGVIACSCFPNGVPTVTCTDACGSHVVPNCDCNDGNAAVYPCAPEILCDGLDENCSGADCCPVGIRRESGGTGAMGEAAAKGWQSPPVFAAIRQAAPRQPTSAPDLPSWTQLPVLQTALAEPLYVVAVKGDDRLDSSTSNAAPGGVQTLKWESCSINMSPDAAGILGTCQAAASTCQATVTDLWAQQCCATPSGPDFGMDAVLYFDAVFPFNGVSSETPLGAGTGTVTLTGGTAERFNLTTDSAATHGSCSGLVSDNTGATPLTPDASHLVANKQSSSSQFCQARAYYQMVRLMSYVYSVGGISGVSGGTINTLGVIERHPQ
jgi:hypothetical protein